LLINLNHKKATNGGKKKYFLCLLRFYKWINNNRGAPAKPGGGIPTVWLQP